jgi:hypothetical protein
MRKGKEHRLKVRKHDLPIMIPLNFLLGCSQVSLDNYELARLAEAADLRKEALATLDRLIQQTALSILARWFRESDRAAINAALAIEETPEQWAKRMARDGQREGEELLPLPSLPPGAAHLAAALRYQERNIAEGKCQNCPQPLDPGSVRFCTKHLVASRAKYKRKGGDDPGSLDFLYQEETPPEQRGRQPGTLAALAIANAQRQRAVLAELGIPPESAAITLDAAKESLLKNMPTGEANALVHEELALKAMIPSLATGQAALKALFDAGLIQRTRKGTKRNQYRYFAAAPAEKKPAKPSLKNHISRNAVLLATLRGEEPGDE